MLKIFIDKNIDIKISKVQPLKTHINVTLEFKNGVYEENFVYKYIEYLKANNCK